MQIGLITVDGRQIGIVTQSTYTPDLTTPALSGEDIPTPAGDDLGGYSRLGHGRGFYPGAKPQPAAPPVRLGHKRGFHPATGQPVAEEKAVRLGHKKGFHPAAVAHDGGAPAPILDQARSVALRGGPGAVQRFMAEHGYPKDGNWCGEFAASVVQAAGGTPPKGAAVASNWRRWGTATATPQPGDIAVRRGVPTGQTGSHVTIVEGYDPKTGRFIGLGGNQGAWEKNFPAGQYEFRHGAGPTSAASPAIAKPTPANAVRGSWFDDRSTATGLSAATTPGIALPSREGLGKMHEVTGPSGQKVMLPQIDIGPAKWTGRGIDISRAALAKLGYTEKNFPTDASFYHRRADEAAAKARTETAKPPEDL